MARHPRVVIPNLAHHITQRGNRKMHVFGDQEDRRVYLRMLVQRCLRYSLNIFSYCLMTNHIHLVAIPDNEHSLSNALRDAHGLYALYFNQKYDLTGHLWQGRFYACVLDEDHLWEAIRYVERNPVRAKIVEKAELYPWSSAAAHCKLSDDPLLTEPPGSTLIPDWASWLAPEESSIRLKEIREKTKTGRPYACSTFIDKLEAKTGRCLRPRKPGRKPSGTIGE